VVKRIGIVDLGSNTMRLVVYECEPGAWYRLADQVREPVRLAEGAAKTGALTDAAMERALNALRLYGDYARDSHLSDLAVVATSAARDAANGEVFLDRVRRLDLDVTVLDGEQEAAYGVLAVANSFDLPDAWVMDLGGGSAQVSRMRRRAFESGAAYPLGAVRVTELFLDSDPPSEREIEALREGVRRQLAEVVARIADQPDPLIAMGGTVRNLARAVQKANNYPLSQVHGFFLSRADLDQLVKSLCSKRVGRRARMAGIQPDRADVIVGGALVYQTLLWEADLPGILVSGQGLREGVFFSRFLDEPHLVPVVRDFGIRNLFAHYPQPIEHTEHVRFLCRRLFDELEPLHGYGWEEARLLDEAAQLHDIGMAVGYHGHDRHGAFLIDNGQVPGMPHRDLALLALLVRYHRKGIPTAGPFRRLMAAGDEKLLLRLSACLRLAEYLERARADRVKDLDVEIGKKKVTITLIAEQDPAVEVYEALKQAPLFERAFGKRLVVASAGAV
jgi:exopolyphosphatase/guanosine-5'-triphosphate,3'-diphosphate pyrophosphatase